MIQQDYLIRLIKRFFDALARMIKKREQGKFAEAEFEANQAYGVLGITPDFVNTMSSETIASLLSEPEKIRLMAKLAVEEAKLLEQKGDPLTSTRKYIQAAELVYEARARKASEEDVPMLQELFRNFPTSSLGKKYREPT